MTEELTNDALVQHTLATTIESLEAGDYFRYVTCSLEPWFQGVESEAATDMAATLAYGVLTPHGSFDTSRHEIIRRAETYGVSVSVPDYHTVCGAIPLRPTQAEELAQGYPEDELRHAWNKLHAVPLLAHDTCFARRGSPEPFAVAPDGASFPFSGNSPRKTRTDGTQDLDRRVTPAGMAALPRYRDKGGTGQRTYSYTSWGHELVTLGAMMLESRNKYPLAVVRRASMDKGDQSWLHDTLAPLRMIRRPFLLCSDREMGQPERCQIMLDTGDDLGCLVAQPRPIAGGKKPPKKGIPKTRALLRSGLDPTKFAKSESGEFFWNCVEHQLVDDGPSYWAGLFYRLSPPKAMDAPPTEKMYVIMDGRKRPVYGTFFAFNRPFDEATACLFNEVYQARWGATENVFKEHKRHHAIWPAHSMFMREFTYHAALDMLARRYLWREYEYRELGTPRLSPRSRHQIFCTLGRDAILNHFMAKGTPLMQGIQRRQPNLRATMPLSKLDVEQPIHG